jgi:hypothetical protein
VNLLELIFKDLVQNCLFKLKTEIKIGGGATRRAPIGQYRFARIAPRIGFLAVGSGVDRVVQLVPHEADVKRLDGAAPGRKVAAGGARTHGDAVTGMGHSRRRRGA